MNLCGVTGLFQYLFPRSQFFVNQANHKKGWYWQLNCESILANTGKQFYHSSAIQIHFDSGKVSLSRQDSVYLLSRSSSYDAVWTWDFGSPQAILGSKVCPNDSVLTPRGWPPSEQDLFFVFQIYTFVFIHAHTYIITSCHVPCAFWKRQHAFTSLPEASIHSSLVFSFWISIEVQIKGDAAAFSRLWPQLNLTIMSFWVSPRVPHFRRSGQNSVACPEMQRWDEAVRISSKSRSSLAEMLAMN